MKMRMLLKQFNNILIKYVLTFKKKKLNKTIKFMINVFGFLAFINYAYFENMQCNISPYIFLCIQNLYSSFGLLFDQVSKLTL